MAYGIAIALRTLCLWLPTCIEKSVRFTRAACDELRSRRFQAMEAATFLQAIEVSTRTAHAASGVSVTPSSGASFANHLRHAMEAGKDDTSGLKPAGYDGGSVNQPSGIPDGKDNRLLKTNTSASAPVASPVMVAAVQGSNPSPISAAAPSGPPASPVAESNMQNGSSASPSAMPMALSWLTAMLPDLLGAKPAKQGQSTSGTDSSANTGRKPDASDTKNQQGSDSGPSSALSREAASAANRPDPARALVVPSTTSTSIPSGGRPSAEAGASPDQRGRAIQDVSQTAETDAFSLLAKSTTAGAGAIPSVMQSMTNAIPTVAAGDGKTGTVVTTAAHSQAAAPPAPAKDTTPASTSLTQTAAASAGSQGVKAVNGISADSKNGGSQDSQGKGSGTPAAPGAIVASQAGASAAVSNAAQAAANGFPTALSQTAATAGTQSHASVPTQGGTPQPTTGEKIAVAMETPVGLPQTTVSAASLLQSQARSEMRVAVQTENMGAVELHAVLASGKLGASISVVSHEAHTLLNNELPALQQVLTDQNLRIDHLSVINAPMSSGAGAGDSRGFNSGDYTRPQGRDLRWYSAAAPVVRSGEDIAIPGSARRLSVRA